MNKIFLMIAVNVGLMTLFTHPCSCEAGDLIKSFTVNGAASVSVAVGQTVSFICTKQDNVTNPKWDIRALASGEYVLGGSGISIQTASVTNSNAAKCSYNGTVECRATSGNTTDAKTVTVIVACGADGKPVTTTPKNGGTNIVMKPNLLFFSAIFVYVIFHGKQLIF